MIIIYLCIRLYTYKFSEMQYYPINLVRQKLYANENVLITFHLITFHSIAFSKKKR